MYSDPDVGRKSSGAFGRWLHLAKDGTDLQGGAKIKCYTPSGK
jgi:hypothetical protein